MSKIVFAYTRVSGKGQIDKDGPARQTLAIQEFCKANRLDLDTSNLYFEPGISGTTESIDRPAFSAMILRIEQFRESGGEVEGIVVERLDRLARDLMVSELLLAECRSHSLKVFSTDQGSLIDVAADDGDPTRVLIRQILGALAQWEKTVLVKKLKSARDRIKARGERCEGRKPFGTRLGEQAVLDTIKLLASSTTSAEGLAQQLTIGGHRTRKGGKFTRQSVLQLMKRHNIPHNYEPSAFFQRKQNP